MSLYYRCDECSRWECTASFAGAGVLPEGWFADGGKHYCSAWCLRFADRSAAGVGDSPGAEVRARDQDELCTCGHDFGDHLVRPPHSCVDDDCLCRAFEPGPARRGRGAQAVQS